MRAMRGLAGLTLAGDLSVAPVAEAVRLRGVHLRGADAAALTAAGSGARVELEDVLISDPSDADPEQGGGLFVRDGATARLNRVTFLRTRRAALTVVGAGSALDGEEVHTIDTRLESDGLRGRGLIVDGGATARLSGLVSFGDKNGAVVAYGPGSAIELQGSAVLADAGHYDRSIALAAVRGATLRGQQLLVADAAYRAVYAAEGGRVEVDLLAVLRAGDASGAGWGLIGRSDGAIVVRQGVIFLVRGEGASADRAAIDLEDVAILDPLPAIANNTLAFGLRAMNHGVINAQRLWLARPRVAGIRADGGEVHVEDALVESPLPRDRAGDHGHGVELREGARAQLARVRFEGVADWGALVVGGSRLEGRDVAWLDPLGRAPDGRGGSGLAAVEASKVRLEHARFEGHRLWGAVLRDAGTELLATDLTIRDTVAGVRVPPEGRPELYGGVGLGVFLGARAELRRAELRRGVMAGLVVERDAELAAADLRVLETAAAETGQWGVGLVLNKGARAELRRFESSGGALAGLVVAGDSVLDAASGLVRDNAIGLSYPDEASLAGPLECVLLEGNGVRIDTERRAVPSLADVLSLPE